MTATEIPERGRGSADNAGTQVAGRAKVELLVMLVGMLAVLFVVAAAVGVAPPA